MQIAILCIYIISESECKNLAQNYEYTQKQVFSDLAKENKEFIVLDFDNYSEPWIIKSIQQAIPQFSAIAVFVYNKEKARVQPIIAFLNQLLRDKVNCILITKENNTLISKVLSKFPNDTVYHNLDEEAQKELLISFKNTLLTKKDSSF